METKDRDQIRNILDRSPRTTLRMYELSDMLKEDWVHFYVNKSAVLCIAWSIMLWAKNEQDLIPLLKHFPTDKQQVDLFCIENRFTPFLEKHVAPITINAECDTWTLNKLLKKAPVLESLTVEDAPFVNDHWDYKSEDSLGFIRHCLESMPSSCIRNEKGQPTGMAFCYAQSPYYINMGGFKVLPEYRRQGWGRKIHLDMCNKVLAQNRKPLVHIKIDNAVSQRISKTTGFKRHERVFWGELNLKK
jgi:hypothetical protein